MKNILVTGATGNTGSELIRFLYEPGTSNKIIAGVRNIENAKELLKDYPQLDYVHFDFEDPCTFEKSLEGIDSIFLLRPPHISDAGKYFRPLIAAVKKNNINEVVFLSVQGAEKSRVIPHNKIERIIKESGTDHIFLRPAYFMQNLTTTLAEDIKTKREIILPAGKAKFNWIDIENIAEAAAILLESFRDHKNQAFEITGPENASFIEVSRIINDTVKNPVRYRSVNPFSFYMIKKREGMTRGMIIVMILLHFLPRFQKAPAVSDFYERLTGKKPADLKSFIERQRINFLP